MKPLSLYLHFPYCLSKCHYCPFNSTTYDKAQSEKFLSALRAEIDRYGSRLGSYRLASIYLGGGTPSIFRAHQVVEVLESVRAAFHLDPNAEISLEANPGTVDLKKFTILRQAGVSRLSLGVQSFWDDELRFLGRVHSASTAHDAFEAARAAGFANINIDLIYAFTGQTLRRWVSTIERAVEMKPEHLSAYSLMIEPGTRFGDIAEAGSSLVLSESRAWRYFRATRRILTEVGYPPYEISNFAQPGFACRHNLVYWNQGEYLGLGPGAHSYLNGMRFSKTSEIERYLEQIARGEEALEGVDPVAPETAFYEALVFGLRTSDGVDLSEIGSRVGIPTPNWLPERIACLEEAGYAIYHPPRLLLREQGLAVCDGIAAFLQAGPNKVERAPKRGLQEAFQVINFTS